MSEEEKKAIEYWKRDIALYRWNTQLASEHYAQIILNLIENQQKELNSLKEIEKSHKKENEKLRIEFEKVYEDNLSLAKELKQYKLLEANINKANKIIAENKFEKKKNKELEEQNQFQRKQLNDAFDRGWIHKDKIKEKIELLKDILKAKEKDENIYKQIPIEYLKGAIEQLEELLEEK